MTSNRIKRAEGAIARTTGGRRRRSIFQPTQGAQTVKRATARWMLGAPRAVLSCHKDPSKDAPADSFTVYFKTDDPRRADYLSMSALPFHPQGICCSDDCEDWQRARFMRSYRGRKIKWSDLPEDCQKAARNFAEAE